MAAIAALLLRQARSFTSILPNNHHILSRAGGTFNRRVLLSSSTTANSGTDADTNLSSSSDEQQQQQRIPRGDISGVDARAVAENLPLVLSHLRSRRANESTIDAAEKIAALNEERVSMIQERDKALNVRKTQSAVVGQIMRSLNSKNNESDDDDDVSAKQKELEEAKRLSGEAAETASQTEERLSEIESTVSSLLASLPNLLDDSVPDGDDDTQNEEVKVWGDIDALPKKLDYPPEFTPLWHDDVASSLNGWKSEQAVAMSGARFVALTGPVARLERAISSFFLDLHTSPEHGYTEVSPPLVVSRSALEGTSQLPKFEDDLFRIDGSSHTCNGEDAFLIPTAEVPLTNMHRGALLDEDDLPISYVALTPCFRAEAGSYGRDTRGLIRTHQFAKVELVKITTGGTSEVEHEGLTRHAERCLELLELPYRKVRLCSGDIGFSARLCYDLEVWLPGQGVYKEISSCSNTGDFQARRMALRYRPKEEDSPEQKEQAKGNKKKKKKKVKPEFCHTINGSGLAVGRTLVAILENYQLPGGGIAVPKVLQPYMGGLEVLKLD
eukprot:CAMPEP_0172508982 /NCGR_PEP_ID=MMETSP1066-20121228/216594_1 /TAXON_ID=671091 /ORGANISM="Coscinodiscus wailesii, Strain CCMP2513" /LENGTH=555 /DNA_ID=CAMNT_0013287247 /DNA_START=166 /DNA_END=1833 /DNA_ORIENTATION=-